MEEFLGNLRDEKIMARMVIKSILNYSIFSIYFLKIFLHKKTMFNLESLMKTNVRAATLDIRIYL